MPRQLPCCASPSPTAADLPAALAGAILNSWGRFAAAAFTPALFNLSLIGCALWLAPGLDTPIHALAWGVLLAGMLQLCFLAAAVWRLGLLPRPRWRGDRQGPGASPV